MGILAIPTLTLLLAAVVSAAAPATITKAMVTKTDPDLGTPLPATSFLTTDARAYVYVCLSGVKAGDVLSVTYYNPTNAPYEKASGAWEPASRDGDFCIIDDYFSIAGDVPAGTPGEWSVLVYNNGAYLATLVFQIVRPGEQIAAPTGTNLIRNPGADRNSFTDNCYLGPVSSWSTLGGFTLCRHGSTSYPSSMPGPSDRGANFFAGGPDDARSAAWQYIDLTAASAAIDTGGRTYTLSGWLGGWAAEDDQATLTVSFRNASGAPLGTASIGPVLAAERNRVTSFLQKTRSGAMPSGARSVEILLEMKRVTGAENDGIADSLSFVLNSDQPACVYTISATSASVAATGGSGSISVTAGTGCPWTAASNVSWITVTSGASGTGNGVAQYAVGANTSAAARTGTLTVAGKTFTVTQAAATSACTYSISPVSASIAAAGGAGSVTVTAGAGCAWTAASGAAWLSIASGASGSGSGTVQYSAAANTGTAARTGTLTIAGQTFTANQAAPSATGAPAINSGGVVNTADYTANFAPGGMISIFGTNLARSLQVAGPPPLPTALNGASVEAIIGQNTVPLPIFFVSPGQVNAQLPFDAPLDFIQIRVRTAAGVSDAETISISRSSPRLFTVPSGGTGQAALLHSNFQLVSRESPGTPGEWLIVYLTGLGEVSPAIAAGRPGGDGAGNGPLNKATATVTVTVGGRAAEVYFAGLAPGYAGLYQINFKVPDDALQGIPEVVVEASGSSSQRAVTFQTSLNWAQATVTTIGPAGGTVSSGQMTVTVPSGALAGPQSLSIRQTAGPSPADQAGAGPMFELDGLPATSAPITVTISTAGNPLPAQGTYVVVTRPDGSDVFVKARVQGNQVTAPLPPQSVTTVTAKAPSAQAAGAADADSLALILYLMTGIHETASPKKYFEALTVGISAEREARVLEGLDSALEQLMAMGFEDKIRPRLPFSITIAPSQTYRTVEQFGYVQDSVEYREAGGQISWLPRKTIRLDSRYILSKPAQDEMYLLVSVYPREDTLLRVKAGHLLFHLVQQLYDAERRKVLAAAGKVHPWDWWDEANAVVFERRLAGAAPYIPSEVLAAITDVCGGSPFACGLDTPLADANNEGRRRGLALALFLDLLVARRSDLHWIGYTYQDLDFLSASLLPSQALVREFDESTLSSCWVEFAQSVGAGFPHLRRSLGDHEFVYDAFRSENLKFEEQTEKVSKSWTAPDFSVKFFMVKLDPYSNFAAGTRFKIAISGGIGFIRQAYGLGYGGPIGTPGNTFDLPVDQLAVKWLWLSVGVANIHVNSKQPHSDNISVQFSLVQPSGCPDPATGKAQGLSASVTTCGVSGGLDEAAKAAWVAAQAAKGTSVTADGGIISLSINPDGTGWVSPTVTYQCHSWDTKGNDLQRVVNYSLTVDNCYTNMSYCKGTYVVTGGYEIWNKGTPKQYGTSTSSWTAQFQADGTYLLKIPNGYPPLWGDIPYRLK